MKKTAVLVIALLLAVCCAAGGLAERKVISPDMELKLSDEVIQGIAKSNPEVEGENPLTGLPASEEPYTPMTLVLDNSPEVYPHWGVAEADWIFQVPQRRDGGTRLVAVYSNEYPEQAGGVRSARMTTLPIATLFKAAPVYAGFPPVIGDDIRVDHWLDEWDFNKPIRYVDLLSKPYKERVDFLEAPQNLSAHLKEIHEYFIGRKNVKFEKRPFLFADEPRAGGDKASQIYLHFLSRVNVEREEEEPEKEDMPGAAESTISACSFTYSEENGYTRTSKTGVFTDRVTEQPVYFQNIVILRSKINWDGNYAYYDNHLKYYGQADYFMNGKHYTGAWYRAGRLARLVLLDENGQEISLQRGKTYAVIYDEYLNVIYE